MSRGVHRASTGLIGRYWQDNPGLKSSSTCCSDALTSVTCAVSKRKSIVRSMSDRAFRDAGMHLRSSQRRTVRRLHCLVCLARALF